MWKEKVLGRLKSNNYICKKGLCHESSAVSYNSNSWFFHGKGGIKA